MEKTIREAEARIQENMVLTKIRKIAKLYGGAVFIIGLSFFIFGLIMMLIPTSSTVDFPQNLSLGLFIIGGVLLFISGLLHMST